MEKVVRHPAFPWVFPFALFMAFLAAQSLGPEAVYWIYPIKTLAAGAALVWIWPRIRGEWNLKTPLASVIIGVGVFFLWVGLEGVLPRMGKAEGGFDPTGFEDPLLYWGSVAFRIAGAVLVVPLVEELFWRGFLMRYLIKDDFQSVPLGTYAHLSFWATTVMVTLVHVELGVAFLTAVIFGAWFIKTRSLGSVVLAHAVTNLILAGYVLGTGRWYLW